MIHQATLAHKRLATQITHVRPLARMHTHMLGEVMLALKRLPTEITYKRPFASVGAQVRIIIATCAKHFFTVGAHHIVFYAVRVCLTIFFC